MTMEQLGEVSFQEISAMTDREIQEELLTHARGVSLLIDMLMQQAATHPMLRMMMPQGGIIIPG